MELHVGSKIISKQVLTTALTQPLRDNSTEVVIIWQNLLE